MKHIQSHKTKAPEHTTEFNTSSFHMVILNIPENIYSRKPVSVHFTDQHELLLSASAPPFSHRCQFS